MGIIYENTIYAESYSAFRGGNPNNAFAQNSRLMYTLFLGG